MTTGEPRKVAIVTGAGSGIGRATAAAFVAGGYAVALLDRNEEAGRDAQAQLNAAGECIFIPCDVADDDQVKRAVDAAVATFGRLDAAFNGAGIDGAKGMMTEDAMLENWQRVIAINLTGVWHCMRHELRAMLSSGGGAIVNCASIAGMVGAAEMGAYVAAKHGVLGLTKAAALEYARHDIRINAVCPGIIDTPMTRLGSTAEELAATIACIPTGRMGTAQEIAAAAVWLCGDGASYVTGQALALDGAWTSQ
jgi:NAD(P)-dependent dehydrogenase (short-subunit alcohol dehydrogenase family)